MLEMFRMFRRLLAYFTLHREKVSPASAGNATESSPKVGDGLIKPDPDTEQYRALEANAREVLVTAPPEKTVGKKSRFDVG